MTEAFIYDAVRTPRGKGKPGGALYEVRPVELLATLLAGLEKRHQLDTSQVEDLLLGCVTPIGDQGYNVGKAALLYAGWSDQVPALQLNRYCASGLEAVNLCAAKVQAGLGRFYLAGGLESMSRVRMGSDGGALLSDPELISKVPYLPQGVAADLIATIEGFSREQLDAFAVRSHERAAQAQSAAYFSDSLIPVHDRNGLLILDHDETVRANLDTEKIKTLPPAFQNLGLAGYDALGVSKYPMVEQVQHLHTAANSSGIVDGATLVLVGDASIGKELGLQARARIRSMAVVCTEPTIMLKGPVPACEKALKQAGLRGDDIDLWEINEAFAAVPLQVQKALDIPDDKLNVNGGAIAMGHPLGATGAILLGTVLDELERRDLRLGLASLCAGAGIGIATIIERL